MKRALVVIDVQNEYDSGKWRVQHPPLSHSLSNIGLALDAARVAGIPVIMVQQNAPEGAPVFAHGSHGWHLHDAVADHPGDALIVKSLPSAFTGTDLDEVLTELGCDTLTLVGYMTHNCVDSTAKDALHRGYAVEVLHDATGTLGLHNSAGRVDARQLHESIMVALQARFAAVAATADWVDAVHTGRDLERGNLVASIQSYSETNTA
ncbi:cysteine hydrolase family protein [Streptomyces sp. FZ201]|uniref:cysteine hydrolase family protein n=1 Tax=Streptomyces sp. FZ201 TaxID=3057122 RepID=UPI0021BF3E3B|nr:cysteine hydrolase family protein [Streptomyces sp. FZ201]